MMKQISARVTRFSSAFVRVRRFLRCLQDPYKEEDNYDERE
jgi:hypothetical protein